MPIAACPLVGLFGLARLPRAAARLPRRRHLHLLPDTRCLPTVYTRYRVLVPVPVQRFTCHIYLRLFDVAYDSTAFTVVADPAFFYGSVPLPTGLPPYPVDTRVYTVAPLPTPRVYYRPAYYTVAPFTHWLQPACRSTYTIRFTAAWTTGWLLPVYVCLVHYATLVRLLRCAYTVDYVAVYRIYRLPLRTVTVCSPGLPFVHGYPLARSGYSPFYYRSLPRWIRYVYRVWFATLLLRLLRRLPDIALHRFTLFHCCIPFTHTDFGCYRGLPYSSSERTVYILFDFKTLHAVLHITRSGYTYIYTLPVVPHFDVVGWVYRRTARAVLPVATRLPVCTVCGYVYIYGCAGSVATLIHFYALAFTTLPHLPYVPAGLPV